jgi:hypothetical protein
MVLNGGGLTIPLRVYPVTTLADARRKAEVSRKQVSNGIDPSNVRKITKAVKQLSSCRSIIRFVLLKDCHYLIVFQMLLVNG